MSKIIVLFLLLLPSDNFAISKAPEVPPPTIPFEFYNAQSTIMYYPIRPIIIQNTATNIINISPLISYTYLRGETQFQMLVSLYPIENHAQHAEYITISSPSHTITLPLVNKQMANLDNNPKNINQTKNIGYTYLFPEDITNLQLLILEPKEEPFYSWRPQQSEQYISNILTQNKALKPMFYQTKDLQHFYSLQQATTLPKSLILERHIPFFVQEKNIVITLHGKTRSQQWYLSPYHLWTIIELIELYTQLTKGIIPYR